MSVEIARPAISPEIVRQHLDQVAERIGGYRADGLFVFRNTNILAFCGVPLGPSDRMVCGLVNADLRVAFVVPAFEASIADGLPEGSEVFAWEEHHDPYSAVAAAAEWLGIANGSILLDRYTWIETQEALKRMLPRATLKTDPGLIDRIRSIKTGDEIEAVRAACRDTGRIYPLITKLLRTGISELELHHEVHHHLIRSGLTPDCILIQGGESAAIPHQSAGPRVLQMGDAVIVDYVGAREGFHGDMTRTFALGRPSEEAVQAYAIVRNAQKAARLAVQPGVTCDSIDRAARSVIENAGLGDYFVHRLGHGIGLDGHEPPYLVLGNEQRLEPGMCVTIEPGVYVPGRFGIRIEDTIVVTPDGCAVLSDTIPTDVSDAFR